MSIKKIFALPIDNDLAPSYLLPFTRCRLRHQAIMSSMVVSSRLLALLPCW
jgi:hypothetical protein